MTRTKQVVLLMMVMVMEMAMALVLVMVRVMVAAVVTKRAQSYCNKTMNPSSRGPLASCDPPHRSWGRWRLAHPGCQRS